jgi:membrane-bound lytic murein transglycosylase MltF
MVAAQGYQESRLDQSVVSKSGAIGVMQLLPSTANDKNVGIPDIHLIDKNIHAGTKYLRFLVDRYFSGGELDELNRHLFGFAAYNAGPARVAKLRAEAKESGLDPNVWFDNVEVIASKRIGRETVQYVSNIYKYYIAYRLILNKEIRRQQALKEAA